MTKQTSICGCCDLTVLCVVKENMTTLRTMMRPILPTAPETTTASIPPIALFFLMLAVVGALLTVNPILTLVGLVGFVVLYKYFWTRNQPVIVFWALLHQWIQVNIGLFYADLLGEDHSVIFTYKAHADEAYLLGMCSLFALGLGFWIMTRKISREKLDDWLEKLDPQKCLKAYLTFIVSFSVIASLPIPDVGQVIMALSSLKWGFFYLFFMSVMYSGRYRLPLVICMLMEFIF